MRFQKYCVNKIPLCLYMQTYPVTQEQFMQALSKAVDKQLDDRDKLTSESRKQLDKSMSSRPSEDKDTIEKKRLDCNGSFEPMMNGIDH